MGGCGSGRPRQKNKVDACRWIDVNRLKREGCLRPGWAGHWNWWRDGQEVAQVGLKAVETEIVLDFNVRLNGGDWELIKQTVPLSRMACNFGNERPYFQCPGIVNGVLCRRRVCKLYAGGRHFLCRHCYDLSYNSQSEDKADRALRRANNIRIALGGEPGMAYPIARKPKGMWKRTYQSKQWQILHYENQASEHFLSKYRRKLSEQAFEMHFEA